MYQIGSDGGLLDVPVPLKQLLLAPGERADLLIDFSKFKAGPQLVLTDSAPASFPDGSRQLQEIMQFTVGTVAGFRESFPGPQITTRRPAHQSG